MSSAGIQAGPAGGVAAATDKGRQQIQFSGKSGVSYFEQLMMKRHRYDPMCLSRAAAHVHTTPTDRVDIALESNNDGGLPADEGTLSNYNIFYDVEPAESSLPHNDIEEHISTPPPSAPGSSSVEIVELDVCQLSTSSARADDVKIHPIELGETSPKPVAVVKPRSSKSSEATRTRPKSTNKKRQIQSSRLKYKSKPRSTHHASPKAPSDVTESDIQSSVKKAWSNCSEQPQLTRFFLQGVEADDNKVDRKAKSQAAETAYKVTVSKLSSTIWLPGNSVSSTNTNLDAFEINPATDLPPAETHRPKSPNQSPPLAGPPNSGDAPASESDNEELAELELSVSNVEEGEITWTERQERDEQDEETLESLAWELASTVECEGRLTRCQSEMDKLDSEIGDASSQREQGLGGEEEAFVLSDLSQVMSEFELHQQSVMEQDSD